MRAGIASAFPGVSPSACVGFVLLVAAVPVAAYFVLRWYAYDNWIVTVQGQQIVVKQGQPGGVLWFHPKVVDRTTHTLNEVLPHAAAAVHSGRAGVLPGEGSELHHSEIVPPPETATTTTTTTAPPRRRSPPRRRRERCRSLDHRRRPHARLPRERAAPVTPVPEVDQRRLGTPCNRSKPRASIAVATS